MRFDAVELSVPDLEAARAFYSVVEHGSWFRGQLYVHRCDLSWDGQWLVYFAMGPTRQHYSWTAVSRPPWVKAELFYSMGDTWNGGGVWTGPGQLWLNLPVGTAARDTSQGSKPWASSVVASSLRVAGVTNAQEAFTCSPGIPRRAEVSGPRLECSAPR